MRRFHRLIAESKAEITEVADAFKLFEQERRNDLSAEAIASYLNKPVESVVEALRLLGLVPPATAAT
jgi:hypothetical protein